MNRIREFLIKLLIGKIQLPIDVIINIQVATTEENVIAIKRIQKEQQDLIDALGIRADVDAIREKLTGIKPE